MNFPKQWGAPQVILLVIGIIALGFLISFIASVVGSGKPEEFEDERGHKYYRHRRRRLRWSHGGWTLLALIIGVPLLILASAMQEYLGLTGKIQVAHVRAIPVKNSGNIPMMSVELVLYDDNGSQVSDNTYIVNGDEVFIGGDIIALRSWVNILGFHSGYKLTKLEGMYSDVNLERTQPHTVQVLNGGDDDFFNTAYHNGWNTFFVTAAYKNGSSVPTNGIGYNICVSQDAIVPQPDNTPC